MFNLFRMELLRHAHWMVIAAAAHFFALYYLFWLNVSVTSGISAVGWLMAMCVFAGAFGVVQMKLYRRSNEWVYLLHRPMRPGTIHIALLLAGVALLTVTLLLPAVLMLIVTQADGRFGTELRHYQMPVFAMALALTAYGVGQFAVLGASRLAFLAAIFACIFINQPMVDTERLVAHTFLMIWALLIAHLSFKSDLARLPAKPIHLVLTELPVMLGCYFIISLAFAVFSLSQRTSSTLFGNPAADSFAKVALLDDTKQLQFALEQSTHPDADFLAQQTVLSEVYLVLPPLRASYPQRHQIPLQDDKLVLLDSQDEVSWQFLHGEMLYAGTNIVTGADTGWLGPDGFHAVENGIPDLRFSSIPLAATNNYLVDDHNIYQIDWEEQSISLRFSNDDDERFADSLFLSENIATIFSDKHLFIFSMPDLLDAQIPLLPRASLAIAFPVADGNQIPGGIHVMELINGYLVSAFMDNPPPSNIPEFVRQGKGRLDVWRLLPGQMSEIVASVPLSSSYSEFAQYADLIMAPGIRTMTDVFWGFKLRLSAERTFPILYTDFPGWVVVATLLCCAFCGGIVAWLLRRSQLPARTRNCWIAISAFAGLPALLAFLIGHYWGGRDRLRLPLPVRSVHAALVPA